jgi:hypothetical protein
MPFLLAEGHERISRSEDNLHRSLYEAKYQYNMKITTVKSRVMTFQGKRLLQLK